MNRAKRKALAAPAAALLLIGGAAAVGPWASMEPGAHADMSPGPGRVWCKEHREWHEHPKEPAFDPLRRGVVAPPGKVWVPEHGHFHDLPTP